MRHTAQINSAQTVEKTVKRALQMYDLLLKIESDYGFETINIIAQQASQRAQSIFGLDGRPWRRR